MDRTYDWARAFRIARSLTGASQTELAAASGVSSSTLSLIESGQRVPSLGLLQDVSAALDVPMYIMALLAENAERIGEADTESELARTVAREFLRKRQGLQTLAQTEAPE